MNEDKPLLDNDLERFSSSSSSSSSSHNSFVHSHKSDGENSCWICRDEIEYTNIKYCNCEGYISLVHEYCLTEWINTSGKLNCDFCHTTYKYDSTINYKYFFQNIYIKCITLIFLTIGLIYTLIPNDILYFKLIYGKICVLIFIVYLYIDFYKASRYIYTISQTKRLRPI